SSSYSLHSSSKHTSTYHYQPVDLIVDVLGHAPPPGAINEYYKLKCASSVCNVDVAISTLQNSCEQVVEC
ncbi:hypothetical protein FRX31_030537, partial [Thalictrum thalictroides]